jgi:hypothetical protein
MGGTKKRCNEKRERERGRGERRESVCELEGGFGNDYLMKCRIFLN